MHITKLYCSSFRNYQEIALDVSTPFILLHGPNGSGKTNLLEAISMLSPGRGFRHAKARDQHYHMHNTQRPEASEWVIRAELSGNQQHQLATAHQYSAESPSSKRIVKANGEPLRSQQQLRDYLLVLWFLPSMSHLFQEGMSVRRKYFDRIAYGFDASHASRVHAYEHYMRERNRVLAMTQADEGWLDSMEHKMAEYSVAIADARLTMITKLNAAMEELDRLFPRGMVSLEGAAEQLLESGKSALESEHSLRESLQQNRHTDRISGRCSIGAHRSAFQVTFLPKQMPAELCSTGEQKALLLSIMLAQLRAHSQWELQSPILLLDEMVAHLDHKRRSALFDVTFNTGGQVWATGTDSADFSALPKAKSTCYHIENGKVQQHS